MRWRTPDPIDQAIQRMRAANAAQAQQTQLRADIAADRERQLMASISARGAHLGHDPDTVRAVQEAARADPIDADRPSSGSHTRASHRRTTR